jgi:hypothetical protein
MDVAEFNRLNHVQVEGTCASCVKNQSAGELPQSAAASVLGAFAADIKTSEPMHLLFYRGKLQSLMLRLAAGPDTALSKLTAKFGPPSKTWHFDARGICVASDQYLWHDQVTEMLLETAGAPDDPETSLSLGDRQLNAAASARGFAPGEPVECGS